MPADHSACYLVAGIRGCGICDDPNTVENLIGICRFFYLNMLNVISMWETCTCSIIRIFFLFERVCIANGRFAAVSDFNYGVLV